jgi:glycosyltransferase involved in cell wall biosynthesis
VTVILPVFNGGAHLRRAIESVIAQTAPPDEVMIVDDGSPDDCLDFISGLSAPFPIRVQRRTNAGQSAARNAGAHLASGGVLAFLDQDDHWHRDHLARLVPMVLDDPHVGWAYSDFDEIDGEGGLVTHAYLHHRGLEHPKTTLRECVAADLMVVPSASVIRKQAFDELGGFDESLQGYEDDDLYVRMFRSGWRFAFQPDSLTSFRVHTSSHSANAGFADSRVRYAHKLATTVKDDPRTSRYYFRDVVAPRFFQTCLDDYVRAVGAREWKSARATYRSMRQFGRRRRYRPGWRLAVIRSPRVFRVMLRVHDRLPRRLRLTQNPILRLY